MFLAASWVGWTKSLQPTEHWLLTDRHTNRQTDSLHNTGIALCSKS